MKVNKYKKKKKLKSVGTSITGLLDKHLNRPPLYKHGDFDITIPIRKPKGELQKTSKLKKIMNKSYGKR